jgi:hypothetical protein
MMSLRSRVAVVLALLIALPTSAVESLRPGDFAVQMPLTLAGPDGLHVIELTEAVYRAAASRSLADLRVFNARGEALPLAVLPIVAPDPPAAVPIELTMVPLPAQPDARESALKAYAMRIKRDAGRTVVEIASIETNDRSPVEIGGYLIDARRAKDLKGRLMLAFGAEAPDFAARVDILGSDDLVNWRVLTRGPLARNQKLGDLIERAGFELARPPSFLRVQWSAVPAPALVGAQFSEHRASVVNLPRLALSVAVDGGSRGSFLVDVPRALPIERLFFHAPQLNESFRLQVYRQADAHTPRARFGFANRRARDQWVPLGSIEVFRVARDGIEVEGQPLVFTVPTDRLRLDPDTTLHGAPPIVEAEWRPARIAFAARAPGPYLLAIGHRDATPGPALDLRSILPETDRAGTRLPVARIMSGSADQLASQAAAQQRLHRIVNEARWSRYLLWAVLLLAVGGLAWMALRLWRQMNQSSADAAERKQGAASDE